MTKPVSVELRDAAAAFEVAGFPELVEQPDGWVEVLRRDGFRRPYLPAAFLRPRQHKIVDVEPDDLTSVSSQVKAHWVDATSVWARHALSVMETNLGEHGRRAILDVLPEMAITAALLQDARSIVSAVRIVPRDPSGDPATHLAVWHDSTPYTSADAIVEVFEYDGTRDRKQIIEGGATPLALLKTVLKEFSGRLSVLSATTRVDFEGDYRDHDPEVSEIEVITGGLLVARLPHVASRA